MVRGQLVIADYGPTFTGWVSRQEDGFVCVASEKVRDDAAARQAVRELVRKEGADCRTCAGCLIGQLA